MMKFALVIACSLIACNCFAQDKFTAYEPFGCMPRIHTKSYFFEKSSNRLDFFYQNYNFPGDEFEKVLKDSTVTLPDSLIQLYKEKKSKEKLEVNWVVFWSHIKQSIYLKDDSLVIGDDRLLINYKYWESNYQKYSNEYEVDKEDVEHLVPDSHKVLVQKQADLSLNQEKEFIVIHGEYEWECNHFNNCDPCYLSIFESGQDNKLKQRIDLKSKEEYNDLYFFNLKENQAPLMVLESYTSNCQGDRWFRLEFLLPTQSTTDIKDVTIRRECEELFELEFLTKEHFIKRN